MRQLHRLLLSCGAAIVLAGTLARAENALATLADRQVQLAQQELARVQQLVEAGALPRARIQDAEAKLEDAKDAAILARDMYGDLPDKTAMEQVSSEMTAAAQRRFDREQARVEEARRLVDSGVAAKAYVDPLEAELNARRTALDFANVRAHLLADMANRQAPIVPAVEEPALDDSGLTLQGMEHYEGDGAFKESRDLPAIELAFSAKFDRSLPISAEGETEVHRALGFDHRGRVDVALVPSGAEGVWLREYLQARKIPYYAFSHAIPGKATAAHIHIGPGSTHLVSQHLSKHSVARGVHTAD
ncbi:MAG TPA: hypothetical protein VFW44_12005 [Bryobacteraceae bacterium]|nr:hypothetical protein [Bryobacteraceae bacterium]